MNDSAFHFTKREMQRLFLARSVWIILGAVGLILGLAGPFGTAEVMRLLPRCLYWLAVAALTYVSGACVGAFTENYFRKRGMHRWIISFAASILIAIVVWSELIVLNWLLFGFTVTRDYALALAVNVFAISAIITVSLDYLEENQKHSWREAKLIDRLAFENRAPIISLSVSDHYTEVTTTKGSELVLIRLSDAIGEAGEGVQIHRSHWVSLAHIKSVTRKNGKAMITTSDDRELPVSRTYLTVLKKKGYLT